MKQRVRVVGIVRKGDNFLLLKRDVGRVEEAPIWELPTGKINFGEQPEETITRVMEQELGILVLNINLKDVITFVALSNATRLYNLYIIYEIIIPDEVEIKLSEPYIQYKFVKYGSDTMNSLRLEEATRSVLGIEFGEINNKKAFAANGATIYTDGASRGNPGPSGIGYYIVDENGNEIKRGGEFIGFATSRVAEYYALKEGCEQAVELGLKSIRFVADNLMMVNQFNGIFRVKNQDLIPIYNDIQKMLQNFEAVAFVHTKRESNTIADEQANIAIDRHFEEHK